MKPSLQKARAALAALPRCTAKSRQSGAPCKLPGTGAGGKCRFHGGASTGRPATHGRRRRAAELERDWLRLMLGCVVAVQGGSLRHLRPGRLTPERIKHLLHIKAEMSLEN